MIKEYSKVKTLVDQEGFKKGNTGVVVSLYSTGSACEVRPGRKSSTLVVSTNPSKDRNITQIQVSPNGSAHHGSDLYVKVSTKDIGVVKIVEGSKKTYNGRNEKATVIFKKGGKSE